MRDKNYYGINGMAKIKDLILVIEEQNRNTNIS